MSHTSFCSRLNLGGLKTQFPFIITLLTFLNLLIELLMFLLRWAGHNSQSNRSRESESDLSAL
jgi:hypothetical protein